MKKIFLLSLCVFTFLTAISQDILIAPIKDKAVKIERTIGNNNSSAFVQTGNLIFYEGFNDFIVPDTWYLTDHECTWQVTYTSSGSAFAVPDRQEPYVVVKDADCALEMTDVRLVTPIIDLSTVNAAVLQFVTYNFDDVCEIEVTTDQGTSYTSLLTMDDHIDDWQIVEIPLDDFIGSDQVRISFTYSQNNPWGYGWAIDDVAVIEPREVDLAIVSMSPTFGPEQVSVYPEVEIKNVGELTQQDFDIYLDISDGTSSVYNSTLSLTGANLEYLNSEFYTMIDEWSNPQIGKYIATVSLSNALDDNSVNDTRTFEIEIIEPSESYYYDGVDLSIYSCLMPFADTTKMYTNSTIAFPMAMEYANGTYYLLTNDSKLSTIDILTGNITEIATLSGYPYAMSTGLAWDWINEVLYVCVVDGSNISHLCTVDVSTGVLTYVGEMTGAGLIIAVDFDNLHDLYGISIETDILYQINTGDGSVTEVGYVGQDLSYGQDISYDMSTGVMYAWLYGENSGLHSIDLKDGSTEMVLPSLNQMGAYAFYYDNNVMPEFISFEIPNQVEQTVIDYDNYTVSVVMAENQDLSTLTAEFVLPYTVTASVSTVSQESGVTENNFTSSVTYILTEEGGSSQEWIVNVSHYTPIAGSTCESPIEYVIVDDPTQTGFIEAGEEVWYSFEVQESETSFQVSTCASDFDTKLSIYTVCNVPYPFRHDDNSCEGYQSMLNIDDFTPNLYYVRIEGFAGAYGNYSLNIHSGVNVVDFHISNVEIYPNPSNGEVNIKVDDKTEITIFDYTGKIIDQFVVRERGSYSTNLSAGVYMLHIHTDNSIEVRKLVVE